ncbi:TadE/TadG family type IV pilus assembly protein [Bacillus daqingensis]|uniref:TadE/TadG family type IV pilus assembly protein n=1 Tax=Bacillus daqingensis TaxID=872396 RepID=A0ABV9NV46_9BACI
MIRKQTGQSLVEFALLLPVFIILVVGIVDFGRVLYTQLELQLVAQESVRLGGLGETDGAIQTYVANNATRTDGLQVSISPSGSRAPGTYVTVELTYPEQVLGVLGTASIPYEVRASSTIRVE